MSKNKHVSILMEKINLDYGIFVFKPISIIKGNYEEEDNTFQDEYGTTYFSMSDAEMIGYSTEETHCFSDAYSDYDLKKMFPDADNKNDRIQMLLEDALSTVWIGTISSEKMEEIQIIRFDVEGIEQGLADGIYEEVEYDPNNIRTTISLTEEALAELLKTEDISELKKKLSEINEAYQEGKKQVYAQMGIVMSEETQESNTKTKKAEKSTNGTNNTNTSQLYKKIDIMEMYKYITDRVIGQEDAVKQIITTFLMNKIELNSEEITEKEMTRMFITGATGSGKTLIIDTMLQYLSEVHKLHLPIATVPTSQLTSAGYVGMNLEDILDTLLSNTKGNFSTVEEKIKYAERNGIVYLDELDKKGSRNNADVSGRGVLNALLEFLTGADYEVGSGYKTYKFNTKYLTIIASGAFSNVFDKTNKQIIGFGSSKTEDKKPKITVEDFVTKGLMPRELMGRFHRIINLNPMTIQTLKKIMSTSRNSTLLATKAKLKIIGVDFRWDESFIDKVAEEAFKSGFGARRLKSIIEESLQEIEWEALNKSAAAITVTAETVDNPKQYIIERRGGGSS